MIKMPDTEEDKIEDVNETSQEDVAEDDVAGENADNGKNKVVKEKSKEVLSYYLKEPYIPFGLFILLSIILNVFIPLEFFPGFIQIYVGLAFIGLALLILRWAFKHMRLNGETWSPLHIESRVLIVFGPYHYTRNPMFLSAIILYISLFLFLNNLWGFILLLPLVGFLSKYAIQPREEHFRELYGETYEDYHNKTGRWL